MQVLRSVARTLPMVTQRLVSHMSKRRHDRDEMLADRLAGHGLQSASTDLDALAIAVCGFRDDRSASGMVSLAMRIGWPNTRRARNAGQFVTVMSARGAPHTHRRDDLELVRAAMTTDLDDLETILGDQAERVAQVQDPVGAVAAAMADVVGTSVTRSANPTCRKGSRQTWPLRWS